MFSEVESVSRRLRMEQFRLTSAICNLFNLSCNLVILVYSGGLNPLLELNVSSCHYLLIWKQKIIQLNDAKFLYARISEQFLQL